MPVRRPGPDERWRCGACGGLTRFDVERRTWARDFVHVDLAGEPSVRETTQLDEELVRVTCRWCGSADRVEVVPRPGQGGDAADGSVAPRS